MNKIMKFMCLFLSVVMIITSAPMNAMAYEQTIPSVESFEEGIDEGECLEEGILEIGSEEENPGEEISDEEILDEENPGEGSSDENAEENNQEDGLPGEDSGISDDLDETTGDEISDVENPDEEIPDEDLLEENPDEITEEEISDEEIPDEEGLEEGLEETAKDKETLEITVLKGEVEGKDYESGSVYAIVDSREEAEEIAEFFEITLESYDCSVAYYSLPKDVSVAEIVQKSVDNEEGYPILCANHYGSVSNMDISYNDSSESISVSSEEIYDIDDMVDVMKLESYMSDLPELEKEALLKENKLNQNKEYSNYQWHHDVIGSTYAWTSGIKGKDIKVAILSTGILKEGSDIDNYLMPLPSASRTKIAGSYYAPEGSTNVEKCYETKVGDGTALAEIIGEEIDEAAGVGIAPECSLYNIKITAGDETVVTESNLLKAINYASGKDIDVMVIDACFSYPLSASYIDSGMNLSIEKVLAFARSEGIAVFAPGAYHSNQNETWPAGYSNVISVTATDKNNQHLSGAGYSSNTDIAAPGDAISTARLNATGCLPAVAIAAGEAALILSQKSSIKALQDADGNPLTGEALVDALKKHMKASTISAGKECGAGIVYLPKALSLGTVTTAPTAPTIIDYGEKYYGNEIGLNYIFGIEDSYYGVSVYYTTNGQKPTYKNGVIGADSQKYPLGTSNIEVPIDPSKKELVINAIAVDEVHGLVSPVVTKKIPLNNVRGVVVTAPTAFLNRGSSLKCTATVVPNNTYTSGVIWKVTDVWGDEQVAKDAKVTVNTSGTVTAAKGTGLFNGPFHVWAISKKNSAIVGKYEFSVLDTPDYKSLKILDPAMRNRKIDTSQTGENLLKNVWITNSDGYQIEAYGRKDNFTVTSSNTKVVAVKRGTDREGNPGQWISDVKGPGKATINISCMGLKTSFTYDVVQNATRLIIEGGSYVVAGKSITLKAVPKQANAFIKDVTWELYGDHRNLITNDKRIKISKGKITTTKELPAGKYYVIAKAKNRDNTEINSYYGDLDYAWPIEVASANNLVTKIEPDNPADKNCKIFTDENVFSSATTKEVNIKIIGGKRDNNEYPFPSHFEVKSSNVKIVKVDSVNSFTDYLRIKLSSGGQSGKATITVKALDGGNAKLTFTVTAVNPASAVRIVPAKAGTKLYVKKGKSIKLKAVVVEEYGKVSSKNVTWSLANPTHDERYATINPKTGELKVKTDSGADWGKGFCYPIYVQATASDGSGACGKAMVMMIHDYGKIEICDVDGKIKGTDGKAIMSSGTIQNNYGRSRGDYSQIDFYVRIHAGTKWTFNPLTLDAANAFTVSSSNPSLATVALEGKSEWGGKAYETVFEGINDMYYVYHFVGRCVAGTSDNKTGTVKFTLTMPDGEQKLTYSLKITK